MTNLAAFGGVVVESIKVIEEVFTVPVLNALTKILDKYPAVPSPARVLVICESKKVVLISPEKLAVLTSPFRLAELIKSTRF